VRATPTRYDLETVRGTVRRRRVRGQRNDRAESWTPKRYDLVGNATDATVRWFDFLPPARGNAQLTFRGPADSPLSPATST
jgi:hypothetical protein